jgi:hypothetical protein
MFLAWLGTVLFPWKRKGRMRRAKPISISMVAAQNRGEPNPTEAPEPAPEPSETEKVIEEPAPEPELPADALIKPSQP